MDDPELEQRMREGLERQAARTDVEPAAVLASAARRDARGPGARTWRAVAGIGLVAAAVAGIAFGGVALLGPGDGIRSGGREADRPTATVVTGWRTEYWRDVQVEVPEDWGWGGAPQPETVDPESGSTGDPIDCGAEAYVGADGTRLLNGDDAMPYVGRPILQTDACDGAVGEGNWRPPTAPYVWLGAPVQPGTVEFSNGYVMETRQVNGSTVSVATQDPALRARILGSATGSEGCLSEYDVAPDPRTLIEGVAAVSSVTVCAYQRLAEGGPADLVYSTQLGAAAAQKFMRSLDRGSTEGCRVDPRENEFVELHAHGVDGDSALSGGNDPATMTFVVHLGECSGMEITQGRLTRLSESNVAPWAVGGLPAYLVGPRAGDEDWVYDYFKGMQG